MKLLELESECKRCDETVIAEVVEMGDGGHAKVRCPYCSDEWWEES